MARERKQTETYTPEVPAVKNSASKVCEKPEFIPLLRKIRLNESKTTNNTDGSALDVPRCNILISMVPWVPSGVVLMLHSRPVCVDS